LVRTRLDDASIQRGFDSGDLTFSNHVLGIHIGAHGHLLPGVPR
jgi:hypothetical protein